MAKSRGSLIRFSGPPANLSADVTLLRVANARALMVIDGGELPLRIAGDDKAITGLAFSMPADTPPCQTKGRVVLGDSAFDAIVDVHRHARIQVEPPAIEVEASAGQKVTATLNVTNRGNGVLDYDADEAITLRRAGTLARGVTTAFKQANRSFADRLVLLGKEMEAAPSCELAVSGRMACRNLAIGAKTTVTLELEVPAELEPDTSWTGSLALLGTRIRVNVAAVQPR